MIEKWRTVLWSVALFAVTFGLALWLGPVLRGDDGPDQAHVADGALSVRDMLLVPNDEDITVTGFVFVDQHGEVLLCPERTRGEPAFCDGIAIPVVGLDTSRLDLRRGVTPNGNPWAWSADEVTLLGSHRFSIFDARDVLPS